MLPFGEDVAKRAFEANMNADSNALESAGICEASKIAPKPMDLPLVAQNKTAPKRKAEASRVKIVNPIKLGPRPVELAKKPRTTGPVVVEIDIEEWTPADYMDTSWFTGKLYHCKRCDKTFGKTTEGFLSFPICRIPRCYFCFNIFGSQAVLFDHYKICHNHVATKHECPFCYHRIA